MVGKEERQHAGWGVTATKEGLSEAVTHRGVQFLCLECLEQVSESSNHRIVNATVVASDRLRALGAGRADGVDHVLRGRLLSQRVVSRHRFHRRIQLHREHRGRPVQPLREPALLPQPVEDGLAELLRGPGRIRRRRHRRVVRQQVEREAVRIDEQPVHMYRREGRWGPLRWVAKKGGWQSDKRTYFVPLANSVRPVAGYTVPSSTFWNPRTWVVASVSPRKIKDVRARSREQGHSCEKPARQVPVQAIS